MEYMESINIVGGIKPEPLEIRYLPPSDGTSVEITFDDIDYSQEEKDEKLIIEQSYLFQDITDADYDTKDKYDNPFKYMGYNVNDFQREEEKCIINYTRNEDLLMFTNNAEREIKKELVTGDNYGCLNVSIETNTSSDQDNSLVIKSEIETQDVSEKGNNMTGGRITRKNICNTTTSQNNHPQAVLSTTRSFMSGDADTDSGNDIEEVVGNTEESIHAATNQAQKGRQKPEFNLAKAIFSEDLSYREYKERKGRWMCLHCRFKGTLQNIKAHIIDKHRKTEMKKCIYCNIETKVITFHQRMFHKTEVKKLRTFKCQECDYQTPVSSHLVRHESEKHDKHVMVKCELCDKVCSSKYRLYHHRSLHHRKLDRRFSCDKCSFVTKKNYFLVRHKQKHMNPDELETLNCPLCDYQTKYVEDLASHRHKHLREKYRKNKQFFCDRCPYAAKNGSVLKLHMVGHKEKPDEEDLKFSCDHCDYKTHRQYNLIVHKLNHLQPEEIEYFYCYHCDFKAKRKDNLKTHIFRHFRNRAVFECYICNFTTHTKNAFITHFDKHSNEESSRVVTLEEEDVICEDSR